MTVLEMLEDGRVGLKQISSYNKAVLEEDREVTSVNSVNSLTSLNSVTSLLDFAFVVS